MAKTKANAPVVEQVQYKAVCTNCDYKSRRTSDREEAFKKANDHMDAFPSHIVKVMTEEVRSEMVIKSV